MRRISIESTAKLRVMLSHDLRVAESWQDLANRLLSKGFYLRPLGDVTLLHDCRSHERLCATQSLGFPTSVLEDRFAQNQRKSA